MYKFNRIDLPFNDNMDFFWNNNGYLILEDFYSNQECDELRNRANFLIKQFNPNSVQSIFDTKKQEHVDDDYFLDSGDKIRFFFEEKHLIMKAI